MFGEPAAAQIRLSWQTQTPHIQLSALIGQNHPPAFASCSTGMDWTGVGVPRSRPQRLSAEVMDTLHCHGQPPEGAEGDSPSQQQ